MNEQEPDCCGEAVCKVESVLNVDERGQILLPKEIRERAGIHPGDKLALISWEQGGTVCCFTLIRAQELAARVKSLLAPVMKGILQ